jgi:hypothetical protein
MRKSPTHRISDRTAAHVGRHRQIVERVWLPTRESLNRAVRSRTALLASALACLALAGTAGEMGPGLTPVAVSTAHDSPAAAQADVAGSLNRAAPASGELNPTAAADDAARKAEEQRLAAEAAWRAANPTPVGGLDQAQMNNALKIVQAGQAMGLPKRAFVIAVATALQESRLYNLASWRIAESLNLPHEGAGSDHDSVGLFQQRSSTGWGRVQDLMNPTYAATAFYTALVRIGGWESMALTWAAQRVQGSAYPSAYAPHEALAQQIVGALVSTP